VEGAAAARWAALQGERGIPPEILARAEADPWYFPTADFTAPREPADTPSRRCALALLAAGGSVLDVGCGGGAAGLALAPPADAVVGLDRQRDMLDRFAAAAVERGVAHRAVLGPWPAAADQAGRADVVVCHHVLHNVVDLPPFLAALTATARRGVVVEMFTEHPMAWLDPLWERFHGLRRPPSATADDAVAVLCELGVRPAVDRWERDRTWRQDPAVVARRLCLPAARVPEVAAALAGLHRPRTVATLHWTC
jgi:SAM-dependent methyltransferase